MAHELLNSLLSLIDSPKDVIDWLISNDLDETQWLKFDAICTKEEFISYFLNYLQDQFGSVLETDKAFKQTPGKKILSELQSKTNETLKTNTEDALSLSTNPRLVDQTPSALALKNNIVDTSNNQFQSTLDKDNLSEINKCNENQKVVSNTSISLTSPESSTSIVKKQNSSTKKRIELKTCDSNQSGKINPLFKENCNYEQNNTNKSISFCDESFPSLGNNSRSGSSAFSTPNKNESSDVFNSSLSQSNFSTSNTSIQSPQSSLYNNSLLVSPINANVMNRDLKNNRNNNKHYQQNLTSTPDTTPNSSSKNSQRFSKESHSRQQISLGVFMVIDNRSSKKGSGKKSNNTKVLKGCEQNQDEQKSALLDSSSTHLQKNSRRRRKVNPTPLDNTNEKGSKENTAFGDISRPFTQNPQFVNVLPIDKSVDNESFEVERGLIKMERQKKPEIGSNENKGAKESEAGKQDQPRLQILTCTPKKVLQLDDLIIPDKALVENVEILNVLAEVYSGFLDHNLVLNPMTELYFIINLVTIQYKNSQKPLSSVTTKKKKKKLEKHTVEDNNDLHSFKKGLSALKRSLNFDNPLEEKPDECIVENSVENTVHFDEINDKLKNIVINKSNGKMNDLVNSKEKNGTRHCIKINLGTPHNCVYFSTQVLNHQREFLKCLDRVTLKLLHENSLIAVFQPELCAYLELIYKIKVTETNKMKSLLSIGTVDLNVCFQMETDSSKTFPSLEAFGFFRKQRDMFYDILKVWEDCHLTPGWCFQRVLGTKIKNLLTLHADVTNLTHFTRLFKSQMLISCIQSGNQEEDSLDEETASFLKDLKDSNPAKFTQLQKKLVTPSSQNGPVPLPTFSGVQEFYKDFILCANIPIFLTYLENTFVHEIIEMNNSRFVGSDIEDRETDVDKQTKQNFVICLSSLKLLAKFLGFMTSLPYKSETSMMESVIKSQVILRSECLPRIDLQYCLKTALVTGKLSLTVPWVVEYLAMMDHATLRLPYYKKLLEMLYCIYRASNYHTATQSEKLMSHKTAILLKLSIGWLFELPIFPTEFYCIWQSKYNSKALKVICDTQPLTGITECDSLTDADTSIVSIKPNLFLDKLDMVDDRILYSCCPFLKELNILLTSGNPCTNSNTSYRHVTPVSSQLNKSNLKKTPLKHLEIQLEEAFFHGQPMSTRKTVEFVSERVASSCVKYICNNLLPEERKTNTQMLKKIVDKNFRYDIEKKILNNALSKNINELSATAVNNIKGKVDEVIPKICESRVTQSIMSLLSEDCLAVVKSTCVKIAVRMAMDRIDQWIQSHIIDGSVFTKDLQLELDRAFKSYDKVIVDIKFHNSSAPSPTAVIDTFRKWILYLLEMREMSLTEESVLYFWDQLYLCFTERSDLKLMSEKIMSSLSVDLCLFLMSYRNDLFTNQVQNKVFRVWKIDRLKIFEAEAPLARLLSPRNVEIMTRSGNDRVWLTCGKFIKNLLKENILPIGILCDQAVSILQVQWDVITMKNLSVCLNEAIDNYKSTDGETERIRLLLGWVAGVCNDMDQASFTFM